MVNNYEAVAVGAITGQITVAVYNAANTAFWIVVWTRIAGAYLAGVGGVLIVAARPIIATIVADTTIANSATFVAVTGGLSGFITAVYSTFSWTSTCLITIAFSIAAVTIFTMAVYVVKKYLSPSKRFIPITVNDIVAKFGKVTQLTVDQKSVTNNWIKYEIPLQ